jgi:hypothetical protein
MESAALRPFLRTPFRILLTITLLLTAAADPIVLAARESRTAELEPGVSAELLIDWRRGGAELEIRCTLEPGRRLTPAVRTECLERIHRLLPKALLETLSDVPLTSETTFGERCAEEPDFTGHLVDLARSASRDRTFFSRELSRFHAVYDITLYPDLIRPLITHDKATTPPPLLEYVPTGNFSGIVIYVEEELPLFGTERSAALSPSVFPRVLGPELEPLIERTMVAPESLMDWGMTAFYGMDEAAALPSRVGEVPFHASAEAVFGINRTDLVVSSRTARRLRASDHMNELIREGKIAIISR